MKVRFRHARDQEEQLGAEAPPQAQRSPNQHEQRLMFESSTHWGRGLVILLGMVATVVIFLVILTVLPKPGSGNPFESLTNQIGSTNSNSAPLGTPVVGAAAAGAPSQSASLATVEPRPAAAAGTGTPSAQWLAVASHGVPNVRVAPSTNNNPIGNLSPNRQVEVIGKSPDNAWLQIVWDNNQKAWVASDLMTIVNGNPAQIPVVRSP